MRILPISRYPSSPFALSPQFRQTVGTHDGPSVRIRFTHDDVVASGYEAWTSAASRRGQYQVLNFFVQSRTIVVETVKNLDECRRDETGIIRQEFRSCNEYSHFCGNRSVTFSPFERFFPYDSCSFCCSSRARATLFGGKDILRRTNKLNLN